LDHTKEDDENNNNKSDQPAPKQKIDVHCPVYLLHGMNDNDVKWKQSLMLCEALRGDQATMTIIKNGNHRLSEPCDIDAIMAAIDLVSLNYTKSSHRK
jgi:alpha-beta hydrolase superfamily lysophospholipase